MKKRQVLGFKVCKVDEIQSWWKPIRLRLLNALRESYEFRCLLESAKDLLEHHGNASLSRCKEHLAIVSSSHRHSSKHWTWQRCISSFCWSTPLQTDSKLLWLLALKWGGCTGANRFMMVHDMVFGWFSVGSACFPHAKVCLWVAQMKIQKNCTLELLPYVKPFTKKAFFFRFNPPILLFSF